ncbi:PEP-CTERM sorting domain-containing protein [Cognaticolwellia beringensis]|uniref:PEP-CTERM sorting domain-containing protein n=1 Tax=Cognaticolwellia beringensis TaxID=1967665 RepID=A0A222G802_9GAMM|nr:PEP-CTERM sorting domain-containing protein [Cognaticolwellia beringensis]ASP47999.1 PEP-CTERM sorting domain-containing protein [Cognaticolwellia beringensis]
MKKLFTATLVTLAFAGTATADEIYIDNGANYGGNANTAAGDNTTGWKEELKLVYKSNSIVKDVDGDQTISVGDTITSQGGFVGTNAINENFVTAMTPGQTFGGPSNNGYEADWLLSFRFSDLMGTFNGSDFIYSSGTIDWILFDASEGYTGAALGNEVHLFSTTVTGHTSVPGNQQFTGTVGNFGLGMVNGIPVGDMFNIKYGSSSLTLGEYEATTGLPVRFTIDQNTQSPNVTGYNAATQEFTLEGGHNAALQFQVPEPTTLAILGLGLLGFAGASRRKS